MKTWPFLLASLILIGTLGLVRSLSHGESIPAKKPFSEFPMTIAGRWEGQEVGLQEKVLEVLKVSDYLMRVYQPTNHSGVINSDLPRVPVSLYVGYYASQRTGATYHSPQNCLPGAGWQFMEFELPVIELEDGPSIQINKVLIQKGMDYQLVLYWYQDRGRVIASEYWAKGYMIWDAMTQNRTDGSLVRITLPVVDDPEQAFDVAVAFLQDMWPSLIEYLPESRMTKVSTL